MRVVLPFHAGDAREALEWARWVNDLCTGIDAPLLLVHDANVPPELVAQIKAVAIKQFRAVDTLRVTAVSRWPDGPNAMFKATAAALSEPFLWMEPDAIPLKPEWHSEITAAYAKCGKKFMSGWYSCSNPRFPNIMPSGISVYPADASKIVPMLPNSPLAWEVEAAEIIVANGANTQLITHFWGEPNLPPVFVEFEKDRPRNGFLLSQIPKASVVWHRNKDGSLIRLLRKEIFGVSDRPPIVPVFPVCAGDIDLALLHARWLANLGYAGEIAMISADPQTPHQKVMELQVFLRKVFTEVQRFSYPSPPVPGWPAACNWAFQSTAHHMYAHFENPWLWLEADAVVLKGGWLAALQAEYERGGKSFMGPVVQYHGHFNGGAIYPSDTPKRMPEGMKATMQAWDYVSRFETKHDVHDGVKLMAHWWGIENGKPSPTGGPAPTGITAEFFDANINPEAVIVHRIKDGSLIRVLEQRRGISSAPIDTQEYSLNELLR